MSDLVSARSRASLLAAILLHVFLLLSLERTVIAQGGALNAPGALPATNAEETVRTYLQLQEQLHGLQLRLDQNRAESDKTSERNLEVLAARLQSLEQSLTAQRTREVDAMQSSTKLLVTAAAVFAGIGLLAILAMSYLQWRTINRLAEITTGVPANHLLGPGSLSNGGVGQMGPGAAVERSSAKLQGNLQQLERRIMSLEHSGQTIEATVEVGSEPSPGTRNGGKAPTADSEDPRVGMLLGRGQALLNLDKAAEALKSFEEALGLQPRNLDALVKKGMALERLDRGDEALACYDTAISVAPEQTVAYLCKGGLFNRLGRHREALECYEKALRPAT